MKRLAMMMAGFLALSGCQSAPERIKTVEVKVPVKVACIEAAPERPTYQYGVGAYPGESAALAMLAADLEAAKQYGRMWEAVTIGCIKGEYKLVE